jgi:hypothetical protein
MTRVTCEDVRHRLDAFHDQELGLSDQIAVQKHIHECTACADELNELRILRTVLLSSVRPRQVQVALSAEESVGFQNDILTRLKTERSLSVATSVRTMFEDMRLVYAGMGASMAALAFGLMLLNMTQLFADDRPNSLAAQMNTLAARGVHAVSSAQVMPVLTDAKLLAASSFGPIVAADSDLMMRDSDAEYAIVTVVTREGRAKDVELLHAKSGQPVADPEIAVFFRPLVRAVSRARFEPASVDGLPVASSVVLNVPHTIVRPAKSPVASAVPGKKSITLGTAASPSARA